MSVWDDYRDDFRDYDRYDNDYPNPKKGDKYWKDKRGKLHYIPEMDIAHCKAVGLWLHNEGLIIPDAIFTRFSERHKELGKMIRNLDEEK